MWQIVRNWMAKLVCDRAIALAVLSLITFRINSWAQWFLGEFDGSLKSIPFSWMFASSVWLIVGDCIIPSDTDRTGGRKGSGRIRTWRNAIGWGIGLYLLLVLRGACTTVSRWLGIILFVATISGFCLLCSIVVGDRVQRFLRSRSGQVRVLSGFAGLVLCLIVVAVAETACALLPESKGQQAQVRNDGSYAAGGRFFTTDSDLGYVLMPNAQAGSRLVVGDRVVWDVEYTTDEFGRRSTVSPASASSDDVAVFFGCSFLFGEGSEDHQTIPSHFCTFAKHLNAVNYGVPGWGTQHMLALLQSGKLPARVPGPVSVGIYLYLPEVHEARVVGDMDIVNSFGQGFPCFEIGLSGQILRKGNFTNARPLTTLFYNLLGKSHVRARLGLNFPRRTDDHYYLTAAVVHESAAIFRDLFPESKFLVVVYPGAEEETRTVQLCRERGIEVLNLRGLFDPRDVAWHHFGDGHPTPAANALVAEAVAQYLAQGSISERAR